MSITPDQAKTLSCDDYPRPWEIGQVPVFDPWDDYEDAWYAGPAIVYDEDIAPLVAAAPIMAEQIAGMQWEYGIDRENLQCSHIDHPRGCRLTMWCQSLDSARDGVEIAQQSDPTARIVRRLVSPTEETK